MEFGCIISTFDSRDYKLSASKAAIPEEYSCPLKMPVKNQRQVSSCVAHATSSILEYHAEPYKELSTNFIYGIRKQLFNNEGKGMMLRDACKIAADYGDMLIEDCPGNTEMPDCCKAADDALSDVAKADRANAYRISKYFLCLTNKDIKYAVYKYGPVLACIRWYNNYKVVNGVLTGEATGNYGGHAFVIYGYNSEGFLCQNSWGTNWGNKGRFILPYNIKIREARGLVDWNGTDELKEPSTDGIWNLIYKGINALANLIRKLLEK